MVMEYGFCCMADRIIIYPSKRRFRNIRYTNLVIQMFENLMVPDHQQTVQTAYQNMYSRNSSLIIMIICYRSVTWWRLTKLVTISREVFHCECPPPLTFTGFLCIFIYITLSLHNRSPCHSICIRLNTPPCHWHFRLQCSDCLSTL